MELCTQASAILLAPSGAEVIADRNNLIFDNRHFLVSEPCAGLQPIAMFCVAVLAFPGSLRAKATAIAVGVSVLLAMNVVRIASLCVIHARSSEETYELFHISLWPMMFILVSMAMWITWARRVLREA
jgi:exosortase/archaeosortase family protein